MPFMTAKKKMRTNAHGLPGKYSCDRCGFPCPFGDGPRTGCWTNFYQSHGFQHVCDSCKADIEAGHIKVSRTRESEDALKAVRAERMAQARQKRSK